MPSINCAARCKYTCHNKNSRFENPDRTSDNICPRIDYLDSSLQSLRVNILQIDRQKKFTFACTPTILSRRAKLEIRDGWRQAGRQAGQCRSKSGLLPTDIIGKTDRKTIDSPRIFDRSPSIPANDWKSLIQLPQSFDSCGVCTITEFQNSTLHSQLVAECPPSRQSGRVD